MRHSEAVQPNESLGQAVRALVYCQITVFAIMTLAFAAPLSCQQHALMSLLDVDWTAYNLHLAHSHAASPCAFHEHQPGGTAMILSAFTGIVPYAPLALLVPRPSPILVTPILFPVEYVAQPPEQPPRIL